LRKVIFFMLVTLDGFFEGLNHDIGWHRVDKEFNAFAIDQLNSADMLLFGRGTYELMAGFWPTATAAQNDPVTAEAMNRLPKLVFSHTLSRVSWQNTRLVKENAIEELRRLKSEPGKDLLLLGSSNLAVSLMKYALIDEVRLLVNPIVLGRGTALFEGTPEQFDLELIETRPFKNGNVLLNYRPKGKK
jgi:dihydrofolate reductase